MGNSCTKPEADGSNSRSKKGGGGAGGKRDKSRHSDYQIQKIVDSAKRAISGFENNLVSNGKLESNVYGKPYEGKPELDPADGEVSPWYNRDRYCDSYSDLYKQHYMLIGDVDKFDEAFQKVDEHIKKLEEIKGDSELAQQQLKAAESKRNEMGFLVKDHLLAWGNSVRLVDEIQGREGDVTPLKSEGYSIRKDCFTPFLTKYFPQEFKSDELNAHWTTCEEDAANEAARLGPIKTLSDEGKAKLYAQLTENTKKLMPKYEKWLNGKKAIAATDPDNTKDGQYVTITSSIFCSGGFVKDDTDTAISAGEYGHHWGFFENKKETGTWAITWTDKISQAYNELEKVVNPSGRDSRAMFQISPAENTGPVAKDLFEISIPHYELYNPLNKTHNDARNRNHTYTSDEGEMVKLYKKEPVRHIQAEALCKTDGECSFLIWPEGSCLDGVDLSSFDEDNK